MTIVVEPAPSPPWFTVEEFRARYPKLSDHSDEEIEEMRATVEQALEDACGVAFVPRQVISQPVSGSGTAILDLGRRKIREVLAATVDGDDYTAALTATPHGSTSVYLADGWTAGNRNIEISYVHGLDEPPGEGKLAAMILTKAWLVKGLLDERVTQEVAGDGYVVNRATPGMFGSVFGIPAVDAFVRRHKRRSYVR